MKLSKLLALILSFLILFLIVKSIGINNLINTLRNFNFIYLPLIIFILILDYVLAGLNTWLIAFQFKKIRLFNVIKSTFITLVYAVIFPGKTADLLMIPLLEKEKLKFSQATISVGIDKIISLSIKALFGLIGTILVLRKFDFIFFWTPIIALTLIVLSIFLINSKNFLKFIKKRVLKRYSFLFKGFKKEVIKYAEKDRRFIFYNILTTIFKTFLEALMFFLLFLSFGKETNLLIIFFMFSLLAVILLITFPIGISGLGIRELVGIVIFGAVGIDSAIVFNSFILRLALVYLINLATISIYRNELNVLKNSELIKKFKY